MSCFHIISIAWEGKQEVQSDGIIVKRYLLRCLSSILWQQNSKGMSGKKDLCRLWNLYADNRFHLTDSQSTWLRELQDEPMLCSYCMSDWVEFTRDTFCACVSWTNQSFVHSRNSQGSSFAWLAPARKLSEQHINFLSTCSLSTWWQLIQLVHPWLLPIMHLDACPTLYGFSQEQWLLHMADRSPHMWLPIQGPQRCHWRSVDFLPVSMPSTW